VVPPISRFHDQLQNPVNTKNGDKDNRFYCLQFPEKNTGCPAGHPAKNTAYFPTLALPKSGSGSKQFQFPLSRLSASSPFVINKISVYFFSYHFISYHFISYHFISYHFILFSYYFLPESPFTACPDFLPRECFFLNRLTLRGSCR
jgi:hypothetical protein